MEFISLSVSYVIQALRPCRLERHLSKNHKALKEKPKEFFTAQLHKLNHMKLDSSSVFHQETWKLVEASYELSLLIAKAKKPHSVGETLVKLSLAYLVDFFETINNLNLKLQGRNTNIIAHSDVIRTFTEKIYLWKRKIKVGNFSSFSHLNELLSEMRKIYQYYVTKEVLSHLDSLAEEFIHYFPDVSMETSLWTLVHNPFNTDVELLLESLQEEAIDLKCDSSVKRDFETMKLKEFGVKYLPIYPKVGEEAFRVILPFSSTYLCEAGFSALVLKTKHRNQLDGENDLRSDLVRKKQQHPSH
ncbi:zinc finger BED domain-containing protein 5-like [Palaemon carinicauda]|uniref:zinc finger BED domain-containing protein 5-like n=1 Tax=Palaemon carinicauda TaxID=392227 RepID=UPI0035B638E1